MKKNTYIGIATFVVAPMLKASPNRSNPCIQETVADAQKHKVYFPVSIIWASNQSHAPLSSGYYVYEISPRVDPKTSVGRYATPFNHLPSAFIGDEPIEVRLTEHVRCLDLPNDQDMRMGVVRRNSECGPERYMELSGSEGFAGESTR